MVKRTKIGPTLERIRNMREMSDPPLKKKYVVDRSNKRKRSSGGGKITIKIPILKVPGISGSKKRTQVVEQRNFVSGETMSKLRQRLRRMHR